jgi:hypothetical protein
VAGLVLAVRVAPDDGGERLPALKLRYCRLHDSTSLLVRAFFVYALQDMGCGDQLLSRETRTVLPVKRDKILFAGPGPATDQGHHGLLGSERELDLLAEGVLRHAGPAPGGLDVLQKLPLNLRWVQRLPVLLDGLPQEHAGDRAVLGGGSHPQLSVALRLFVGPAGKVPQLGGLVANEIIGHHLTVHKQRNRGPPSAPPKAQRALVDAKPWRRVICCYGAALERRQLSWIRTPRVAVFPPRATRCLPRAIPTSSTPVPPPT